MPAILLIKPHEKDLGGGFMVRRLLPSAAKRSIGPFIFLDHMGPATHTPASNFDVRPHPHIGLATVTYLFEGAMMHRDSMGYVQRIEPGAINWMTAGRGVVHSERTPDDLRNATYTISGLQLWAALPADQEETRPSFVHTPADLIPVWRNGNVSVRVLIGSLFGVVSPVRTYSETLYLDVTIEAGGQLQLPALQAKAGEKMEAAIYGVEGEISIDGVATPNGQLLILDATQPTTISTRGSARFVIIGGAALKEHRFMWWNFVSTRKERIEQAKQEWREQRMGSVGGETEFIPLPD
jgi:redox-sensitive bicupin YhaK (pirin superfamily)